MALKQTTQCIRKTNMKTSFIHLRQKDKQGNISPNGGTTIAYQHDVTTNTVFHAAAHCNKKDNYNKAYGRMKAAGRLKSASLCLECYNTSPREFVEYVHANFNL